MFGEGFSSSNPSRNHLGCVKTICSYFSAGLPAVHFECFKWDSIFSNIPDCSGRVIVTIYIIKLFSCYKSILKDMIYYSSCSFCFY